MKGIDESKKARFVCSIAIACLTAGSFLLKVYVRGESLLFHAGRTVSGYDPVFYLPEYGRTMAELT
jgi:XTP/dITP diphosphohydrolase